MPNNMLRRELGTLAAVLMGMGAIVGTGVYVSIGIAAGVAGPAVVLAIALAAAVAACNGLSSAQLAASHPVSGGTYEYGYRYLAPSLGFAAGWMFLCAKSASAATAALGFSGYLLNALGAAGSAWLVPVALATTVLLTIIVAGGIRQSFRANLVIVTIAIGALVFFIVWGGARMSGEHFRPLFPAENQGWPLAALLHASALMFVAFTGYGRIATLGEEVREPQRTIPRAIIITLILSMLLYMAVGAAGVGAAGSERFAAATREQAAPLEMIMREGGWPRGAWVIAIGAMTAMVGVLLNLILGLSRVLLAMGRRGDMPAAVARISAAGSPAMAVFIMGGIVAAMSLLGDVRLTWSFSAFTVLIYYAITNLAAIRLPREQSLYPRVIPWAGLAGCLGLAFWVPPLVWMAGLGVLAAGMLWQILMKKNLAEK